MIYYKQKFNYLDINIDLINSYNDNETDTLNQQDLQDELFLVDHEVYHRDKTKNNLRRYFKEKLKSDKPNNNYSQFVSNKSNSNSPSDKNDFESN